MPAKILAIEVAVEYWPEQSDPANNRYLFQYQIHLRNLSAQSWTLTHRYWRIVDGNGHEQQVEGAGVVGQTPCLAPGACFTYRSSVAIATPVGSMQGHYTLCGALGTEQVTIMPFSLSQPKQLH